MRGYHLTDAEHLLIWLGPTIWEAEYDGQIVYADDKAVVRKARLVRRMENWTEQTARLFACDCAERVVHLAKDPRSTAAITVARKFALGEATQDELDAAWTAARDAALDAAWTAARDAARDVAWRWQTWRLFGYLTHGAEFRHEPLDAEAK